MPLKVISVHCVPLWILTLLFILKEAPADQNLCSVCTCDTDVSQIQTKTVQCSRLRLNNFPPSSEWPPRTSRLDLSHNDIATIPSLDSQELTHLELQFNKIEEIQIATFIRVRNLLYLNLSFNAFREIKEHVFRGLEFLLVFHLNNNYITDIDSNSFYTFRDLKEFNLRENPLKHLDPKLFDKLLFLEKLDLSNTHLYALDNGFFKEMKSLQLLDLSHNDFSEVPINALRSAEKLTELKFNDNPVMELTEKSFQKLSTLERIELSYMQKLRHVGPSTFSALGKLKVLKLSGNQRLTVIDEAAFVGHDNQLLSELREVDISDNGLAEVSEKMVPCRKLDMYNLQGNPWKCDCRMKWIVNCSLPAYMLINLRCSSPFALKKQLVKSLKEKDFQCSSYTDGNRKIITLKYFLFVVALLLAFMIGIFFVLLMKNGHIKCLRCCTKRKGIGSVYYVPTRTDGS